MKVIAFNGSPRKQGNTATLLNKALEGAASLGAATKLIHLYDFNYKGCVSCFACKLKDGKSYGKCAYKDDLTPILENIIDADALIFGSPIYLGATTGEMRSFLERLLFPYLVYDENHSTLFKKKIQTGFIYTLGMSENRLRKMGYEINNLGQDYQFKVTELLIQRILGAYESLFVTDTHQFDDYSKYIATAFDPREKARRRREEFPNDCKKAFEMGARFVTGSEQ
jgi:multimeric flavodoxin WrbA